MVVTLPILILINIFSHKKTTRRWFEGGEHMASLHCSLARTSTFEAKQRSLDRV